MLAASCPWLSALTPLPPPVAAATPSTLPENTGCFQASQPRWPTQGRQCWGQREGLSWHASTASQPPWTPGAWGRIRYRTPGSTRYTRCLSPGAYSLVRGREEMSKQATTVTRPKHHSDLGEAWELREGFQKEVITKLGLKAASTISQALHFWPSPGPLCTPMPSFVFGQ